MVDAVVLAGDSPKDTDLKALAKVKCKSLIPIAGKPMVEYVVESLAVQKQVSRIAVVGPAAEMEFLKTRFADILLVQHGDVILNNIIQGIEALGNPEKVLVITADIPMITPRAIEDFLQRTGAREADFYYSVVNREDNDRRFPGVKRTYVKLRNGTFTGGNVFLVRSKYVSTKMELVNQLIDLRKEPLKMVSFLGWRFVLKFVLGRLTISELEHHMSRLLGLTGVAVVSPYPEVGTDVDKPSDLELARSVLPYKVQA